MRFWNLFRGGAQPLTRIGDCYVIDTANGSMPVSNVHSTLDEDSLSWRFGANWAVQPDFLLYANISKGYKAGAVPVLAAATVAQFQLVPQESLLAYEAGVKASLFDGSTQVNSLAFTMTIATSNYAARYWIRTSGHSKLWCPFPNRTWSAPRRRS